MNDTEPRTTAPQERFHCGESIADIRTPPKIRCACNHNVAESRACDKDGVYHALKHLLFLGNTSATGARMVIVCEDSAQAQLVKNTIQNMQLTFEGSRTLQADVFLNPAVSELVGKSKPFTYIVLKSPAGDMLEPLSILGYNVRYLFRHRGYFDCNT